MNRKQKTIAAVGAAILIAMALYPPYATWCLPGEPKTLKYGWLLGSVKPPPCADKLQWTWELATDRLIMQYGAVVLAAIAIAAFVRENRS